MRKLIITLTAVAALSAASVFAGLARADTGTPFTASYSFGGFDWVCSGVRTTPTPTTAVDQEECTATATDDASLINGTYSGDPLGAFPPFGPAFRWQSDYDQLIADNWTATVSGGADGVWTVDVTANYTVAVTITPQMAAQIDNINGCASQPVWRADGTYGRFVTIDENYLESMMFEGVSFTPAFYVVGTGNTCDVLPDYHASGRMVDEMGDPGNGGSIYPEYVANG